MVKEGEIHNMIRQADIKDYQTIINIRESLSLDIDRLQDSQYKVEVQRHGFLRPSQLTFEEYKQDLQKIYIVTEYEGKVVGYLRVDEEQELREDTT